MKDVAAIIPARGGSKRFPGKNVVNFIGKPLIAHSIDYARESKLINGVYVSTDDAAIADVASAYKASVLKRPDALATDESPTAAAVAYHCSEWQKAGLLPEWIVLLQPTNPVRPAQLLDEAFKALKESGRSSLVTFSPLHKKFGFIRNHHYLPENYTFGQRMQDIEPRYFENGLLYIVRGELAAAGDLFGPDPYPFIVDRPEAYIDIDEPTDLLFAESLYKSLNHYAVS